VRGDEGHGRRWHDVWLGWSPEMGSREVGPRVVLMSEGAIVGRLAKPFSQPPQHERERQFLPVSKQACVELVGSQRLTASGLRVSQLSWGQSV